MYSKGITTTAWSNVGVTVGWEKSGRGNKRNGALCKNVI